MLYAALANVLVLTLPAFLETQETAREVESTSDEGER